MVRGRPLVNLPDRELSGRKHSTGQARYRSVTIGSSNAAGTSHAAIRDRAHRSGKSAVCEARGENRLAEDISEFEKRAPSEFGIPTHSENIARYERTVVDWQRRQRRTKGADATTGRAS
jgi:hypothetical protein